MSLEDRGKIHTVSPKDLSLLKSCGVFYLQHVNLQYVLQFLCIQHLIALQYTFEQHIYFMFTNDSCPLQNLFSESI